MVERTVISPHFSWIDEAGDLHTHFRGAIIQIPEAEAEKGDALNCFLETRVEYPGQGTPVVDAPAADFTEQEPPAPRRGRRKSAPAQGA